jgi:predicted outer membrane repeat protein
MNTGTFTSNTAGTSGGGIYTTGASEITAEHLLVIQQVLQAVVFIQQEI